MEKKVEMAEAIDWKEVSAVRRKVKKIIKKIEQMEEGQVVHSEDYEKNLHECQIICEETRLLLKQKRRLKREMRNLEEKEDEEEQEQKEKKVDPSKPWSTISFHQLNARVGEAFVATDPEVTIDDSSWPSIDRHLPSTSNVSPDSTTDDPRVLIQRGVSFNWEGTDINVQNLSDKSVFVNSPISNELGRQPWVTVIEIPPGNSLKVFGYWEFAGLLNDALNKGNTEVRELILTSSIRLSFGGVSWGPGCPNAQVTSTPCWIEMRLRKPMVWLKDILEHLERPASSPSPNVPPPGM